MIIDIPFVHCLVDRKITAKKKGFDECYLFAATCLPNRPLLFTAHTERGAVISRLPIHAFRSLNGKSHGSNNLDFSSLCPWSCLGKTAKAITHEYLKDYDVYCKNLGLGKYLFTIDYFDGNFSEDPEQHKTHNIIELESGFFAALPNNYCLFKDSHFTNEKKADYRRMTSYWRTS